MLDNYKLTRSIRVICPRCGKIGTISIRWVRSSHYPYYASIYTELSEKRPGLRGKKYPGYPDKFVIKKYDDSEFDNNKSQLNYMIPSDKYNHMYVGHYDRSKYREQLVRYRNGKRSSRPNGRSWCYLREKTDYYFRTIDSKEWLLLKIYGTNEPYYGKLVTIEDLNIDV